MGSTGRRIVWLASYPKSGNTWFRIFLANLAAAGSGPADINNLNELGNIASDRREFEAVTMLDSDILSHDDIDCLRPRVYETIGAEAADLYWMKAHDAYRLTPAGEPLFGRGIARAAIYLVRDPRDVAVSYAYHSSSTVNDAIRLMNMAEGAICVGGHGVPRQLRQILKSWNRHVTSWLDQTDVPVHLVRYEDLVAAPAVHFRAAVEFAGRPATPEEIERAIRHTDFAELQRQEREKGFAERNSRTAPFFRAGRVGGWREVLTAEQADAIARCHGAVMARLGYEV